MTRHAAALALPVCLLVAFTFAPTPAYGAQYSVGPGHPYATPSAVPWEAIQAGDTVLIYWRSTPYRDKWVITAQGTRDRPVIVRGVPSADGQLPIIDGAGAVTRLALAFWNSARGVIKIGGSSIPGDTTPRYITIENLDVRGARPGNTFTDDTGGVQRYSQNAAGILIEQGEFITIRNTRIHDNANGLFIGSGGATPTRDLLIERNYIYDNGNVGSAYEHNVYSEALNITYQFNRLGTLRTGSAGTNLKDRSAGLTVRYNWIEDGNRQLDLSDSGNATILGDLAYRTTFVYGNVLIEGDGQNNREIVYFGGDSGNVANYRKGTLHFYNNTVVSYRRDATTLFALATNTQHADIRNNIFYVTAGGNTLALVGAWGALDISANWFKSGYVRSFSAFAGTLRDAGSSVLGGNPGFAAEASQDFHLVPGSSPQDKGTPLSYGIPPQHGVQSQYVKHLTGQARPIGVTIDIGAYETAGSIGGGRRPTVALTAPTSGIRYTAPAKVILAATATDGDGTIAKVDFYANGVLIGTDSSNPYGGTWLNAPAGTYSITAIATDNAGLTATSSAIPIEIRAASASAASATFAGVDAMTLGNWRGVYGKAGYAVFGDATALPAWATLRLAGAAFWTWDPAAIRTRALQRASGIGRVAAAWYSATSFSVDVNLSDGAAHRLALYVVDWNSGTRAERINIVDAVTGALLDSRSVSAFTGGQYLVWTLRGRVRIDVTRTGGPNAVVSGVFFDAAPANGAATATFVRTDTVTQGSWRGLYGRDGYSIVGDATALPPWASVQPGGSSPWTWAPAPTQLRALQRASGTGRVAATWYSGRTFSINVNLTDGNPHRLAVYLLDWDGLSRAERIDIVDPITGAVLDSRTASGFTGGQYLVWTVRGRVRVDITRTAGANAVVSGVFLDPGP